MLRRRVANTHTHTHTQHTYGKTHAEQQNDMIEWMVGGRAHVFVVNKTANSSSSPTTHHDANNRIRTQEESLWCEVVWSLLPLSVGLRDSFDGFYLRFSKITSATNRISFYLAVFAAPTTTRCAAVADRSPHTHHMKRPYHIGICEHHPHTVWGRAGWWSEKWRMWLECAKWP